MRWSTLAMLAAAWGCHDFVNIDRDRCGNRVVEPNTGEDCDESAPAGLECGPPGEPGACRYVCRESDCPDGWGCGLDGICRAPSRAFDDGEIRSIEGDSLALADVDGDGIDDLVSTSAAMVDIEFGSADGRFAAGVQLGIPVPTEAPVVADVDLDGRADIVVGLEAGLMMLPGRQARTLVPVATPARPAVSPVFAFAVRAVPPYTSTVTLERHSDGSLQARGQPVPVAGLALSAIPAGPSPAVHVAVADLDGGGTSDEFALSAARGRMVWIVSVECPPMGQCSGEVRQRVSLPGGGLSPEGNVFFGDLDADERLDLLVPVSVARASSLAVAYGGEDGFGPLRLEPALAEALRCAECPGQEDGFQFVTDVADLDGDGHVDFATGLGVRRTIPGDPYSAEELLRTNSPYRSLRFADLNADGRLDVYGGRPESVEVYLRGRDEAFARFTLPLVGEVDQLEPGDFNGDGRTDLAVLEASGAASIVFADGQPYPNRRVPLAAAGEQARIAVGRSRVGQVVDGADDLTYFDGKGVFVFLGDASQLPLAVPVTRGAPSLVAVGRFGGATNDVLVGVSRGPDSIIGRLDGELLAQSLPVETQTLRQEGCTGGIAVSHKVIALDLDDDGEDELVVMEARKPQTRSLRLRILDPSGDTVRCTFTQTLAQDFEPTDFLARDLDGDGAPEFAARLEHRPAPELPVPPQPPAFAFWTYRSGALSEPVQVPAIGSVGLAVAAVGDGGAQSWVTLLPDDDPEQLELNRLELVDGQVVARGLGATVGTEAVALATGDVDGDDLIDVVVKTTSGAVVLRQQECDAQAAASGRCTRVEPE